MLVHETTELTLGGIIFLILAWGAIILTTIYCFSRIFGAKK